LVAERFGPYYTCDTSVSCLDDNTFTTADGATDCSTLTAGAACYKNLGTCQALDSSDPSTLTCYADHATSSAWCQANPYEIRADGKHKAAW